MTDQQTPPTEECPLSQRIDGKFHSWHWDGDDPYLICFFCGETRDAMTGRVLIAGRRQPSAKDAK